MRILYLDIDSLRADHVGCYGYPRHTTPNIDAIASDGVVLEGCYTSDVPCLPSRTAFFGGMFGIQSGVVGHGGTRADPRVDGPSRGFQRALTDRSLAEQLRRGGWHTVSMSSFPHRHSAYQIWEGFAETHDPGGDGLERADVVWELADEWLQAHGRRDSWFLHVNLWDPHAPYDTPLEYGQPFADDAPPAWLTEEVIERQRRSYGPHNALKPFGGSRDFTWPRGVGAISDQNSWKAWIDGYDTGIHYADAHIGYLMQRLDQLGVLKETAIVVSADHGENHGELEVFGDHQTADEFTCHVPAVLRWPGVTDDLAGRALSGLVYGVDLSATVLELAGCGIPPSWDGRSFADGLRHGRLEARPSLVLSQGAWACQRSVRWEQYILVRTYHTGWRNQPGLMLFDLAADPHEQRDLAEEHPEIVLIGLGLIERFVRDGLRRAGAHDPLCDVILDGGPYHAVHCRSEVTEVLRDSGRGELAQWLEMDDGQPREWTRPASDALASNAS